MTKATMTTNREIISSTMTGILFLVGFVLFGLGVAAYSEETFILELKEALRSISDNNIHLEELGSRVAEEAAAFIIGGGVLAALSILGCCAIVTRSTICMKIYVICLLICFVVFATFAVLTFKGHWGVDFDGEQGAVRERFRHHWRQLTPDATRDIEDRFRCCAFDNASQQRHDAIWRGGCQLKIRGCYLELIATDRGHQMAMGFIWSAVALVVFFFTAFYWMVEKAEI